MLLNYRLLDDNDRAGKILVVAPRWTPLLLIVAFSWLLLKSSTHRTR
jgi:hypothetical protein